MTTSGYQCLMLFAYQPNESYPSDFTHEFVPKVQECSILPSLKMSFVAAAA